MIFANNKKLYIKRIIFALLIVATAVFQNTKGLHSRSNPVGFMLPVILVVCISVFEKSLAALFFGAFAGILWDMSSVATDGFFSVVLSCIGFGCAVMIIFQLRNNIFTAVILCGISAFLCNTLYWLFFVLMKGYDMAVYIYFRYYFTSAIFTTLLTPAYYYLIAYISKCTQPERKRINY